MVIIFTFGFKRNNSSQKFGLSNEGSSPCKTSITKYNQINTIFKYHNIHSNRWNNIHSKWTLILYFYRLAWLGLLCFWNWCLNSSNKNILYVSKSTSTADESHSAGWKLEFHPFSSWSICSSDVYRHESGRCHSLPFFLIYFFIILPFQDFLLY